MARRCGTRSCAAIGKPRNLTHVGPERMGIGGAVSQTQVLDALRSGEFTVTDGPAMRIAIDVNGNGVIDDGDVPMGGDFEVVGDSASLLVEWRSTPEFGPVREIHVYVGAQAGSHEGVVYAPQGHGTGGAAPCVESDLPFTDATGREYCPMTDGYVRDPEGGLSITIPLGAVDGYEGTRQIELHPTDYPVFDYECTTETEAIWVDDETGAHWEYVEVRDCDVTNVEAPARLYTRAFVRTEGQGALLRRYAFSNPIWMTAQQVASPPTVDVASGPTCTPPPPTPPTVHLEWAQCSYGTNTFVYSVASTDPANTASIQKHFRLGSGSWQTLTSPTITAGSSQTVGLRARACNQAGSCSTYASTSVAGPYCPVSGAAPTRCSRCARRRTAQSTRGPHRAGAGLSSSAARRAPQAPVGTCSTPSSTFSNATTVLAGSPMNITGTSRNVSCVYAPPKNIMS